MEKKEEITVKEVMYQMKDDIDAINEVYGDLIKDLQEEDEKNTTGHYNNSTKITELKTERDRIVSEVRANYTKPKLVFLSKLKDNK